MKVLGVKEGSIESNLTLEKRKGTSVYKKSFRRTYYVLGDDLDDTEEDVFNTPGVPTYYTLLRGCYCRSIVAREINQVIHPTTGTACGLWEVDADFDSDVNPDDDERPENKPPKIRWHGETEEEVLEKDAITGNPVQTAAGEPILITTPYVTPVLEIRRYEIFPFDPDIMLSYSHRTNSTTFWGAPAGSALMLPMDVDEEMVKPAKDEDPIRYAVVTYKIKFKIKPGLAEPWKARVLHHGFKHRPAIGKPPVIYRDRYGNPATINLDANGVKLADGAAPQYLEFNRFQKADFNALTLGPF